MTVEVDSRPIPGNGGTVYLLLDDGSAVVAVHDCEGCPVAIIEGPTNEQALDAYLHPFASSKVPDIFRP